MTEIGKFLKKLRIENEEVLLSMAQKLGVSPSFLSAVELGKKKMPYEWNLKIRSVYSLTPEQEDELDEAISLSEKAVMLDFEEVSPTAKKLAVSFARSFSDFSDEQLETLRQHRTIHGLRLFHSLACIKSVIFYKFPSRRINYARENLFHLTNFLTAQLSKKNCAVVP